MSAPMGAPFDLSGRVALVTGAASGIGRATALRLAEAGAMVVMGDRDGERLSESRRLVEGAGGADPVAVTLDVTRSDECDDLVREAVDRHGRLDVAVHVAGIMRTAELVDLTEADLDAVLAVNLKGVLFGTQAAIRAMQAKGAGGSIVNITSAAIDAPASGYGAYAISKAGVAMLTRTAAVEAGRHGIRVNAIAPGFVETAMTARWWTGEDGTVDESGREAFLGAVARQGALPTTGEPDDIAWAALYLASDASKFMTGQILRPNGGTAMPW